MSQLRRLLPSLNTLVAFEAVMRRGTFASAAKELGVTGPAVSRTIGRLELHLGLPLFDRTPAGAVPTRDGKELFSGIARGFDEIEGTLARLKERKRPSRRPVVLSVSSAFATHWFMPRLARFRERFPGEEIHFQLIGGPLGGPAGEADIAMRFDHRPEPQEQVVPVMPEVILAVGAPGCVRLDATADGEEKGLPQLISLDESLPDWRSLVLRQGAPPSGKEVRFQDYSLVIQAALVGQGIALGWLNVVSMLLIRGDLVPASSTVVKTGRQCGFVVRRELRRGVAGEICDWIVRELNDDLSRLRALYPALL